MVPDDAHGWIITNFPVLLSSVAWSQGCAGGGRGVGVDTLLGPEGATVASRLRAGAGCVFERVRGSGSYRGMALGLVLLRVGGAGLVWCSSGGPGVAAGFVGCLRTG